MSGRTVEGRWRRTAATTVAITAATAALVLGVGPPAQAEDAQTDHRRHRAPDLVVTRVSWEPRNPRVGDDVTFTAVVQNRSGRATPAGTTIDVNFSVDRWEGGAGQIGPLARGASRTVTVQAGFDDDLVWDARSGDHVVEVTVDPRNRIRERNERNNVHRSEIVVPGPSASLESTSVRYRPGPAPNSDVVPEVVHRIGPSSERTFISSLVHGDIVTACAAVVGGAEVPGTRQVAAEHIIGSPSGPGGGPSYETVVVELDPNAVPATAVAEVDLWGIYRRNQFIAPRRTPCAAGTRSIFISWDVTSVFSYRWTYNSQASDGVIRSTHYEPVRVSVPLQP